MESAYKKVLHISDTHIFPHRLANRDSLRNFCQAVANKFDADKWIVLITGDIVDGAHMQGSINREYSNARYALRPLIQKSFEIRMVPGNHDFGYLGNVYNKRNEDRYNKFYLDVCKSNVVFPDKIDYDSSDGVDGWSLILLNSNYRTNQPNWFAQGRIHTRQLREIERLLSEFRETKRPCLIALHHHYTGTGHLTKLVDADQFMAVLKGRESRVTVCCGHRHSQNLNMTDPALPGGSGDRSLRGVKAANLNPGIKRNSSGNPNSAILIDPIEQIVEYVWVPSYTEPYEIKVSPQSAVPGSRVVVSKVDDNFNSSGQIEMIDRKQCCIKKTIIPKLENGKLDFNIPPDMNTGSYYLRVRFWRDVPYAAHNQKVLISHLQCPKIPFAVLEPNSPERI